MPASADYYSIYEGIWVNWSRGRILGSTITLNRRDGGLLISFIALFITFVGTASWRIICFALHHHLSSEAPRDALHHQQQAVLRNSANGSSGLCSLSHILWTWRHYKSHHPFRRMLPTIILTVLFLGSFAVAGVFSSKIATSTGTEVLVSSPYCGVLNTTGVDLVSMAMIMKPYFVQSTTDAVNYGQNCYTNTSSNQECRTYVKKQLPWTSNRNASCPFPKEMCKNDHSNLELDTGFIDSSDHLGMNGPPEKRVILRSVQRCAPLAIEPFVNKTSVRRGDLEANLTRVYLGPTMNADASDDYTLGHWDYSNPNDTSPDGTGFTRDYKIRRMPAAFVNGSLYPQLSDFNPIQQLRNPQADVETFFLSGNGVAYSQETNDPWYSAHKKVTQTVIDTGDNLEETMDLFYADDVVSVVGCLQSWQLCNPNLPEGQRCSPLAPMMDNFVNAKTLWSETEYQSLKMLINTLLNFAPAAVPHDLGISSLTSRSSLQTGWQGPIPDNQWQLDVEHWFKGGLSLLQSQSVEYATGPTNSALRRWIIPPQNTAQRYFCENQKILTTAYTNFNTFGLTLTLALGATLILTSYLLEPLAGCLQPRLCRWTRRLDKYARLEWCTNETLQLQRLAHEELGLGTWRGGADAVPLTEAGQRLGMVDVADERHPRLKAPPPDLQEVLAGGDEEGEGEDRKAPRASCVGSAEFVSPLSDSSSSSGSATLRESERDVRRDGQSIRGDGDRGVSAGDGW